MTKPRPTLSTRLSGGARRLIRLIIVIKNHGNAMPSRRRTPRRRYYRLPPVSRVRLFAPHKRFACAPHTPLIAADDATVVRGTITRTGGRDGTPRCHLFRGRIGSALRSAQYGVAGRTFRGWGGVWHRVRAEFFSRRSLDTDRLSEVMSAYRLQQIAFYLDDNEYDFFTEMISEFLKHKKSTLKSGVLVV